MHSGRAEGDLYASKLRRTRWNLPDRDVMKPVLHGQLSLSNEAFSVLKILRDRDVTEPAEIRFRQMRIL